MAHSNVPSTPAVLRQLLFLLHQLRQPQFGVVAGLLPSQLRGQNVPSYVIVEGAQVVPVHVYPLLGLVLQKRFYHSQRGFDVPRLSYKVNALEPRREAVLKPLDHEFQDAGFEIRALSEGEFGPVDDDHEAVGLVVDVVREEFQAVQDRSVDAQQAVAAIPVVGVENDDAPALSVLRIEYARETVFQRLPYVARV